MLGGLVVLCSSSSSGGGGGTNERGTVEILRIGRYLTKW